MRDTGVRRLGLIGHPVAHSRSPAMQRAALDALAIPATYELWDTPLGQLAARVASLRQPDMLGANVTIPHKLAVMPLLDAISADAREVGAVNTIVRDETETGAGRLVGHNTDVPGLARALAETLGWDGHAGAGRMLVLGAWGAARSAWTVAQQHGVPIQLAVRDVAGVRALLPHLTILDLNDRDALAAALATTDLLVNATSAGMEAPDESALPLDLLPALPAHARVFDMVYAPPETALVRAAQARGLRASGGLPMLLYQGAAAFTLWTGQPAPIEPMRAALGMG